MRPSGIPRHLAILCHADRTGIEPRLSAGADGSVVSSRGGVAGAVVDVDHVIHADQHQPREVTFPSGTSDLFSTLRRLLHVAVQPAHDNPIFRNRRTENCGIITLIGVVVAASGGSVSNAPEVSSEFRQDLAALVNRHSRENGSNTPDMLLAGYLEGCLENFDRTVRARERWYSIESAPGEGTRRVES